ncbi:MAG: HEAT repeat domain-containing protein [Bacillota bacterium]
MSYLKVEKIILPLVVTFLLVAFLSPGVLAEELDEEKLVQDLESSDQEVILEALEELKGLEEPDSETVQAIILLLNDVKDVKETAGEVLREYGAEILPGAEEIVSRQQQDELWIRVELVELLGSVEGATSVLEIALEDETENVQRAALEALAEQGSDAEPALTEIASLLKNRDLSQNTRKAAVEALEEIGIQNNEVIMSLLMALNDDPELAWPVSKVLDSFTYDPEEVLSFMLEAVPREKEKELLRKAVIDLSEELEDPSDHIREFLFVEDESFRLEAILMLRGLESLNKDAVNDLLSIVEDREESDELRQQAAWTLGQNAAQNEDVISGLREIVLADNESDLLRKTAIRGLSQSGAAAEGKLEELLSTVRDIDLELAWELGPVFVEIMNNEENKVTEMAELLDTEEDNKMKLFAVRILSAAGREAESAVPSIIDFYKQEDDEELLRAAVRSLVQIAPEKQEVVLLLVDLLDSDNQDHRRIAGQSLQETDKELLEEHLADNDNSPDEVQDQVDDIVEEFSQKREVPAFPEAEGFGSGTAGGRKGTIYRVTNLKDSGEGSFRDAVEAEEPRIIVFDVTGTIKLSSPLDVENPEVTIAGQTAPGEGITLANYGFSIKTNDAIVRNIRSRMGDAEEQEDDSIEVRASKNVVVDQVSASWATDETFSVVESDQITIQRSIISEGLNDSVHAKGEHGYGSLIRGESGAQYSFHKNLWAHHTSRMPRPGNYESVSDDPEGLFVDFRNNVFYNWGGSRAGDNYDEDSRTDYNFINNYYKPGPDSSGLNAFNQVTPHSKAYFAGNYMDGEEPEDPWDLVVGDVEAVRQDEPVGDPGIDTVSAPEAYEIVMESAGAFDRDDVDHRIVRELQEGKGSIIDSQNDVGGWPELRGYSPALDSADNHLPDWWLIKYGFAPEGEGTIDPEGDINNSGYTNIEEFINGTDPDKFVEY